MVELIATTGDGDGSAEAGVETFIGDGDDGTEGEGIANGEGVGGTTAGDGTTGEGADEGDVEFIFKKGN